MRIAVNTLPLLQNKAGAERYTQSILQALSDIDSQNMYLVIVSSVNAKLYQLPKRNVIPIVVRVNTLSKWKRIAYEQLILPFLLKKIKANVIFSPCNIMPLLARCRTVTMIFDMHWFVDSHGVHAVRLSYVRWFIRQSACRSDAILTLSQASKSDIITFTKTQSPIHIVPIGMTPLCALKKHLTEIEWKAIQQRYQLCKPYILFLGQLLYRKNIDRAIEAFALLRKKYPDLELEFIIIGGFKESFEFLSALVAKKDLNTVVRFLGQLDDSDVAHILNHAHFFVYPSLYEGFGIPILEALYYNIPTITSSVSSMPEVGGQACLYIEPTDTNQLMHAMERLIADHGFRDDLIQKGQQQVQRFKWDNIAKDTLAVLENSEVS